jgi:hypothetical protein
MLNTYTGDCPYIQGTNSIDISYTHIPILGTLSKNYKKYSFDCIHIDECPNADNCPIFESAPDSLNE